MFGKFIIHLILVTFFFTSIGPFPDASAQTIIDLPAPGLMVNKSAPFEPLQLKGILVNVKNPLRFDFLVDKGDSHLYGQPLKDSITRLAKYFLTCLTVPEDDLWVNLSPYEKERIVPVNFGITLMGKDLLEQDYLLKQMMASLSYPENDLGKRFWQMVYHKSYELYGTTDIPINTFNKVWIIPKSAQVYVQGNAAFVVNSQLDVMLEADYKAFLYHRGNKSPEVNSQGFSQNSGAYSKILREVILPELRKEINEGKNFAVVRQVYNAMILATWYKRHLKDSVLGRMYVGKNKVSGVDIADKNAKEKIFQQYLKAYKKCVYNYIKEDYDPFTQQTVPRKYASGGVDLVGFGVVGGKKYQEVGSAMGMEIGSDLAMATVNVSATDGHGAIVAFTPMEAVVTHTHPFYIKHRIQDGAMISLGSLARKIFMSLAIMIAVSVAAPSVHAFTPTSNPDGTTMQVTFGKEDAKLGFGGVVQQILKKGGLNKIPLWGPQGAVAKAGAYAKLPAPNFPINAGHTVTLPTAQFYLEKEVVEKALESTPLVPATLVPQQTTSAVVHISLNDFPQLGQQLFSFDPGDVSSLTASLAASPVPADSPTVLNTNTAPQVEITHPLPAAPAVAETSSMASPPNVTNSEILQNVKAMWPWYVGIAILGLVIDIGGAVISKRYKVKKLKKRSDESLSSPSRPLPNNIKKSDQKWEFNVATDKSPALPDADELAWIQQQQQPGGTAQVAQPRQRLVPLEIPTADQQPEKTSGLRTMDVLSVVVAAVAASIWGGGNLKMMGISFLASFLATRPFYAGALWLHELGHTLTAWVQLIFSPKDWGKVFTLHNIFGNYGIVNWLKTVFVGGKPSQQAGVDLPLTGNARRFNQAAGFIISSVVNGLVIWLGWRAGFSMPILASMATASSYLFYNSFISDIWKPSPHGRIECGNGGFIWQTDIFQSSNGNDIERFFPKPFQAGLENMKAISELRGDQGKGIFTWGETPDGDIVPIVVKTMKSKRGPPVIKVAELGFNSELKKYSGKNIRPISGGVREIISHDRFLTQGTPSQKGLQPQLGPEEKREISFFKDGQYQRNMRTVVVAVTLNGDLDFYHIYGQRMPTGKMREFFPIKFHMEKNIYIAPNEQNPKGYYDYLPTGDTPSLSVAVQWHANQGDWLASSGFAADEIFYRNIDESIEHNLSKSEGKALGQFYMDKYKNGHEQVLIRPELKKKDKSWTDLWVTKKLADEHPELVFQYKALQQFKDDLKAGLLAEAEKSRRGPGSSEVGRILNRLQDLHPDEDFEEKVDEFVNMTTERYFTAGIFRAVREVNERAEGTFGVRAVSSKEPQKGIFWTRGQSIALGINKQAGYMAYNSEHTALMTVMGGAPPVKEILILNSTGQGQITETFEDPETKELTLKAYSPEKRRFLKEEDLKEWRMEVDPANKYFTPLIQRDPDNVTEQDIADIPRAVNDTEKSWDDPNSFVRQSADDLFSKLVSRYVERFLKDNSNFYKVAQGNLVRMVHEMAEQCQGIQCSDENFKNRTAQLLRAVINDPRILTYLKSTLDRYLSLQADDISRKLITGQYSENDLFIILRQVDQELKNIMEREINELSGNILENNLEFLTQFEDQQKGETEAGQQLAKIWETEDDRNTGQLKPQMEGRSLPSRESVGSGEADLLALGLEDSLWIGSENLRTMMQSIFPQMIIETDSSNKALDLKPNDRHQVGRRTISFIVSKSGATSPSKNLVPILEKITPGNIFAWTGRVDTLIGLALGQRYYKGAPFIRRIFPTGNYYPSEVNSVSEVELLANQIEMILYVVKRMKKIFPGQRPWGMDVSAENIKKLEGWQANMLKKAVRLTGVNEDGKKVIGYRENEEILKNGRIFGRMLSETLLVKIYNFIYVYVIIDQGVPLSALGAYLGFNMYGGHHIMSLFDTILTAAMPWLITTIFYRKIFKKFIGRAQIWGRMGPPKVTIGDLPVLHQAIENSASKRGAMAIASMDADYHGGNPQDHFGVRFLHRLRRGSIELFGIPEVPHGFGNVKMTISQSNVRTDMTIGIKIWDFISKRMLGGPEIFTIGHGHIDPNLTQHHMDIGPLDTVFVDKDGTKALRPDVTETLSQFYENSFDVFDRLIAYNVFFNAAYEHATQWKPWIVWRFLKLFWKSLRIWHPWKSISMTAVMSTPSPQGAPKEPLSEFHDENEHYTIEHEAGPVHGPVDSAQGVNRHGGIDMNSRLMQLKITGVVQKRIGNDDNAMAGPIINGVVPQVSGIVTVTPDMLKAMLGEGYLN